jgi:hypothetical protein
MVEWSEPGGTGRTLETSDRYVSGLFDGDVQALLGAGPDRRQAWLRLRR